jgi:glycosyltransferase involved in cell wall biosynthesis
LASRIGGIPDSVKDGFNGYLLSINDENAWLTAMDKIVKNPDLCLQFGANGRKRVLENNSIKKVAMDYLAFLHSV